MGGNAHSIYVTLQMTKLSDTGSGFSTTGFTFGAGGDNRGTPTGELFGLLPSVGFLQTVCGYPKGGIQSGDYWFTIENRDNVILYQSPATDSGTTFASFPELWYPSKTKFVAHCNNAGAEIYNFDIVVSDS